MRIDRIPVMEGGLASTFSIAVVGDTGDKPDAEEKADAPVELKVVVSVKGGRATIGVHQPTSAPHIESFDDADLSGPAPMSLGGKRRSAGAANVSVL